MGRGGPGSVCQAQLSAMPRGRPAAVTWAWLSPAWGAMREKAGERQGWGGEGQLPMGARQGSWDPSEHGRAGRRAGLGAAGTGPHPPRLHRTGRGRALSGGPGAGPARPLAAVPVWGTPPQQTRRGRGWGWSGCAIRAPTLGSLLLRGLHCAFFLWRPLRCQGHARVRDGQVGWDPRVWRANSRLGEALSPCSIFCQWPAVTRKSPSRQRLGGGDTVSISSQTSRLPLSRKVFSIGQRSSCGPSWLVTLGRPWVWAPGGYPVCPGPPSSTLGPLPAHPRGCAQGRLPPASTRGLGPGAVLFTGQSCPLPAPFTPGAAVRATQPPSSLRWVSAHPRPGKWEGASLPAP